MSDRENPPESDAFGHFLPPQAPPSVGPPVPVGVATGPAVSLQPEPVVSGTQPPPWKPWLGFAAVIVGLMGAGILGAILIVVAGGVEGGKIDSKNLPPWVTIGSLVLQDIAFLVAAVGLAATMAKPRPWHFGWRPVRRFWPAVGWSALLYVSFISLTAVWLYAIGQADEKDTIAQELGADSSTAAAIAIAVLVAVGAPIVEELLFRGVMFGALRGRLPLLPAAAITGLMFGGAHVAGSPVAFILPLAFLGFGLCLLYHRTGSLYPSMAVHAVNNSVAIVGALGWATWLMPVVAVGSLVCITGVALVVRVNSAPVPADAPCP